MIMRHDWIYPIGFVGYVERYISLMIYGEEKRVPIKEQAEFAVENPYEFTEIWNYCYAAYGHLI